MKLSLTLIDTDSKIRQEILSAMSAHITNAMNKAREKIKQDISKLLEVALRQEPEYNSLKGGQLRLDFGISDTAAVDDIIQKMANSTTVKTIPVKINNSGLSGGLTITAVESETIGGLINDSSALVIDRQRGYSLPWLEWLLLKGNSNIIINYDVRYGPNPASRTGDAIMVRSRDNWRVPAQFVGTKENNWTTRAIERIETNIPSVIQRAIEGYI